jgi:hypothetical protein
VAIGLGPDAGAGSGCRPACGAPGYREGVPPQGRLRRVPGPGGSGQHPARVPPPARRATGERPTPRAARLP